MTSKQKITAVVVTLALAAAGLWLAGYLAVDEAKFRPGKVVRMEDLTPAAITAGIDSEAEDLVPAKVSWQIEEVVAGLEVPWGIAWTSPDRMLITERPGRLRVVEAGVLSPDPLHVFANVSSNAEEGLMGLAVDPNYLDNQFLYFSYAYRSGSDYLVRVVRFRDGGDSLTDETIILDSIPAARFHAGARLAFGPDEKLYVTTGDATDKQIAQDLESLGGKTLRLNPDGSIPDDNPFPNSYVWSYGHRNAQGIDWHPVTGELYATEHGPSLFDGPAGGDEVNHIIAGENYGWPLVSHQESIAGAIDPILVFTPAEAPASGAFYDSTVIPQWQNDFFFGALRGEGIIRVRFAADSPSEVIEYEKLDIGDYGRIREVAAGPDGYLYFATSNRDGRGDSNPRDDRILRIIPR